jgi:hypothetical protein
VLELGKAGSAGVEKDVVPVLRDGAVVATLRASNWKEQATAVIGDQEWVFVKARRELTGRWAVDPEGTARLRARQLSAWKSTWELALEGTTAQLQPASRWKGTYTLEHDGRVAGEVGSTPGWSRRPSVTADGLPLHQQVFVLWVQLLIQRRAAAAAVAVS